MTQTTEQIITTDQVDDEGPKAGHSQWKLMHLKVCMKYLLYYFKNKINNTW